MKTTQTRTNGGNSEVAEAEKAANFTLFGGDPKVGRRGKA